jgi:MFS family permease
LRDAWRSREARLLAVSAAASRSGDLLATTALAVILYDRTGSPAWVAAAGVARMVPYIVLSAPAGMVGDRFPRRTVLVVSASGGAAIMAALAVAAAFGAPLVVVVLLAGLASVLDSPYPATMAAITPDVVAPRHLAAVNSTLAVTENVAGLCGPLLAAAALAVGGPGLAFGLDSASFAVAALCMLRLPRSAPPTRDVDAIGLSRSGRTVRALALRGPVRSIAACLLCAGVLHGAESVLLVLVAAQRLGTGAEGLALLEAAVGVGGLLGAARAARRASRPEPSRLAVALVAVAAPLAALALVGDPWLAASLLALQGIALVAFDVMAMTALQRDVPAEIRAAVSGAMGSLIAGGILAGLALTPVLIAAVGLRVGLVVVGAGLPVVMIAAVRQSAHTAPVGRPSRGTDLDVGPPRVTQAW